MNNFSVNVIKKSASNHARVTQIKTPHGNVLTPAFMPVGTRAGVNCMTVEELKQSGSQIILGGNTYHMLCAPGMEVIENAGGMHDFMAWQGPMLTDSGGFQLFSLSKNSDICTIDDEGAHFRHPDEGRMIHMTPEVSMHTQKIIGADIIMAFDQCTPDIDDRARVLEIMHRTHRWLERSKAYQERHPNSVYGHRQALFGIIQGGIFPDLREESARFILDMDVDGIAIGGETVGFDMEKTVALLDYLLPLLPADKTRYTMGVGLSPQDLIDVVAKGVDIFDCVAPTRNARHGSLYCGTVVRRGNWLAFESDDEGGRLQIKKQCFASDERPIMEHCSCYTCRHHSRAQLHYMLKQRHVAYSTLASIHNIHVMHDVCERMREFI